MAWFAPLNPPLLPWPDARVWIIGASTGIGAATARALLAAGARVALSARRAHSLREVAAGNSRALIEPLDFTRSDEVAALRDRIAAAWGGCDLVLIVAGTHREVRACELTPNAADAVIGINLNAPIVTAATVVLLCFVKMCVRLR